MMTSSTDFLLFILCIDLAHLIPVLVARVVLYALCKFMYQCKLLLTSADMSGNQMQAGVMPFQRTLRVSNWDEAPRSSSSSR